MPLRLSRVRRVTVKQPLPAPVFGDMAVPAFESAGTTITATVQPMSGSIAAQLYGEERALMKLLLTNSQTALNEGMGVCLEDAAGACDYRIAAPVERWGTHQRAVLKRL